MSRLQTHHLTLAYAQAVIIAAMDVSIIGGQITALVMQAGMGQAS